MKIISTNFHSKLDYTTSILFIAMPERIKLTSKITIHNPLPVEILTRRLNYTIYIDSVKVIEDVYEKPITIRSADSSTLKLQSDKLD